MPDSGQLRAIFDALGDGLFVADAEGRYTDVNPAACRMLGYEPAELLELTLADVVAPAEHERLQRTIAEMADRGLHRSEWLFRRKDGSTFVGELVGGQRLDGSFQSIVRDVTERIAREELERMLRREAAHRTKNVLAVVQALVQLSAASDPANFRADLADRIHALAASHDLFVRGGWAEIELSALVRAQMKHFGGPESARVLVAGPAVRIGPAAAQAIGMALHELGTNAAKYGALSVATGTVEIGWRVMETGTAPRFEMHWQERGGPRVTRPLDKGFGTEMIVRMVQSVMAGQVDIAYDEAGLRWTLTCPLPTGACD